MCIILICLNSGVKTYCMFGYVQNWLLKIIDFSGNNGINNFKQFAFDTYNKLNKDSNNI